MKRSFILICILGASLLNLCSQQPSGLLTPTPPMGWNSWDSYGLTVTEAEFKANVTWFHQHLQPLGWQYVVVDEGWYLQHPGQKGAAQGFVMDADGRYLVADDRFS